MLHQYQIEIKIRINIEFMQTHLLFFCKKYHFYLHISQKKCNFVADFERNVPRGTEITT